jgi:hypothetical protein
MPDDAPVTSAVLWELSAMGWIIWPWVREAWITVAL